MTQGTENRSPGRRLLWPYAAALAVAAMAVALLADTGPIRDDPALAVVLVVMVVVLDLIRVDLFERLQASPAGMPALALGALFGPLGPIAAEAVIALVRAVRGHPPLRFVFDFGALSLAGAAAAAVFATFGDSAAGVMTGAVVAGLVFYAVNIPLVAGVINLSRGGSLVGIWREQLAWLFPHYLVYGVLAGLFVLAERRLGLTVALLYVVPLALLYLAERQYVARNRASVAELRQINAELTDSNAQLRSALADNERLLDRVHRSYLETITSLARTIEAKDPYTGGHTERVAQMTRRLAGELGFEGDELRAIEFGAVVHDLGKIGIPDEILMKQGPLTAEQRAEMEKHPEISSYILDALDIPATAKAMARHHHERFDGGGYPDGLAAEAIPLPARVLTVADTLDAMTSDRPYRRGRSVPEAVEVISAGAGTQFCPTVVQALHAVLERDPEAAGAEPVAAPARR